MADTESSHEFTIFNFAELRDKNGTPIDTDTGVPYHEHKWNDQDTERFDFLCRCEKKIVDRFFSIAHRGKKEVEEFWKDVGDIHDSNRPMPGNRMPATRKAMKEGKLNITIHSGEKK